MGGVIGVVGGIPLVIPMDRERRCSTALWLNMWVTCGREEGRVGSSVLRWGKYGNKLSGGAKGAVPLYSSFNANRQGRAGYIDLYFHITPFWPRVRTPKLKEFSLFLLTNITPLPIFPQTLPKIGLKIKRLKCLSADLDAGLWNRGRDTKLSRTYMLAPLIWLAEIFQYIFCPRKSPTRAISSLSPFPMKL